MVSHLAQYEILFLLISFEFAPVTNILESCKNEMLVSICTFTFDSTAAEFLISKSYCS